MSLATRGRPLVWWGAGLLVVGVLLGTVSGGVFAASAGFDLFTSLSAPIRTAPTDFTQNLDEGTYVVYEQTATRRQMGPFFDEMGRGVTISPDDVLVIGPDGGALPVVPPTIEETIDRNNQVFTGAVRFTVENPGVHRIQISGRGQQVVLAPGLASTFLSSVGWLAAAAAGAFMALLGLVLLIIGLVRGRDPKPTVAVPVPAPASTPAGWYPDPRGEARLRWWDGHQWSDHVA